MIRNLLYISVLIAAFFFASRWVEARKSILERQKRLRKQGYSKAEARRMAWEEFYRQ